MLLGIRLITSNRHSQPALSSSFLPRVTSDHATLKIKKYANHLKLCNNSEYQITA